MDSQVTPEKGGCDAPENLEDFRDGATHSSAAALEPVVSNEGNPSKDALSHEQGLYELGESCNNRTRSFVST